MKTQCGAAAFFLWNADALWNFCLHKSCMLNIAGKMGRFKTVARAPCSWFSTFHSLSFCSWSLPSVLLFVFFFLFIATTMSLKLHSLGPYLILKIFCCGSLWNQSGMLAPQGGSWAAQEFRCEEDESASLLCVPLSVFLWMMSTSDERHRNSKNS